MICNRQKFVKTEKGEYRKMSKNKTKKSTRKSAKSMGSQFTPIQKLKILSEHLKDRKPVQAICDKCGIEVATLYNWETILFKDGALDFTRTRGLSNKSKKLTVTEQRNLVSKVAGQQKVIDFLFEENQSLREAA